MGKLYYFQAPNFDINPESETAPKLGSIFSTVDQLTAPLNQNEQLTIPLGLQNQSSITNFTETLDQSFQTEVGFKAITSQSIPFSAELIYAFANNKADAYRCDLLETFEFEPDQKFVSESIAASRRVQNFLENSLFGRKRVYMITGLKIASGFGRSSTKETRHSPSLKVGPSGKALGLPVEASPGLGLAVGRARTVDHGQSVNRIVFAYRVIRIKVKRDGEPTYKHRSGGKYGAEESSDDSDEDDEGKWVLERLEVENLPQEFPNSVRVDIQKG
ncbi:uncharacterized protein CTRU02_208570 [Colletotrichum truncatum]|uniref:Uncharacterized protein n=1 Tax=Colletotrichum truncatum TaxID=5467 RepID=A0ACC3YWN4_COLTU|nr:uncharacterized protein CTRU02_10325 [Colletotrichum truncatum]KAF6787529.1 hypothetical protein CTRU02_10325 [Colletotrichum truncatum]